MTKKSFKEFKKEKTRSQICWQLWIFIQHRPGRALVLYLLFFFHYETCSCSPIQEILIRQPWKRKATLAKEMCCVITCHEIPLILPQMITRENIDYQKPISQTYKKYPKGFRGFLKSEYLETLCSASKIY